MTPAGVLADVGYQSDWLQTLGAPFMRNAWKSRSSARSLLIGSSLTRVISIEETWVSRIITALPVHSTM